MRTYFALAFLFVSSFGLAQSTNVLTLLHKKQKKADYYYDMKAWRNALELYRHITDRDPEDLHARIRIAECYVRLNNPVEALMMYTPLMNEPSLPPLAKYEYAEVLCTTGNYSTAKEWFEKYAKEVPGDTRPKAKIEFIDRMSHFMNDSLLTRIVPLTINSKHSDFGPQFFRKGLVFASSRDIDLFIKRRSVTSEDEEEAFLNLFYAKGDSTGNFGSVRLYEKSNLRSTYNDGPIAFYDHNTKAVFTKNTMVKRKGIYDAEGRMNLELFFADVSKSGQLTNIQPFVYNGASFSTAHGSLTPSGNLLYFSSNKPNGFGGADIYYCRNENGIWTEPVNAGAEVNTPGDEFYPFSPNDSTLFFSSTGHGGFGGMDIFLCNKRKGKFKKAMNLGYPMNSYRDDFSMVLDSTGRYGYFASNRPGGEGLDDIYSFNADRYFALGQTRESPDFNKVVPGVTILVRDEDGVVIDSTKSDSQGWFRLDLPLEENFSIWAKKEGYDLLEDVGYSTKGRQFGIDSVMFPLWKQDLFVKGKIYSKETQMVLPGAIVTIENLTDNKTDSLEVNANGEYTHLVYPNRKYRILIHKPGFIPGGYNLNTGGLYKGELLNDVVLEEVYIEKGEVNFDFNRTDVSSSAANEINKIIRTLRRFPTSILSIRAHADSRGSAQYNQLVSDKRAKAVMQYAMQMGIPRNRIDAKGFGEELVLNRCSDGVECSEEEHSKNRRAELKVQRD